MTSVGFEPTAYSLGNYCSIQLSYEVAQGMRLDVSKHTPSFSQKSIYTTPQSIGWLINKLFNTALCSFFSKHRLCFSRIKHVKDLQYKTPVMGSPHTPYAMCLPLIDISYLFFYSIHTLILYREFSQTLNQCLLSQS